MSKDNCAICLLSLVPCRKEPDDRTEMLTQLLFGDLVKVTERRNGWLKIKTAFDSYEAWVDIKQIERIPDAVFNSMIKNSYAITEEVLCPVKNLDSGEVQVLCMGSRIFGLNGSNGEFSIDGRRYSVEGNVRQIKGKTSRKQLVEDAYAFLNAPYLWGGKSILGIDCSGFSQLIYTMGGIELPRDSGQQAEMGHSLSFIEEAAEGDLAFFDNDEGRICHVGIILGKNKIIHASGKVRIDRIDHQGIFRDDINGYSHSLRIIKKIL